VNRLPGWIARLGGRRGADHLELGRRGERDAARFLRGSGMRVLAKNLRTPGGEADLVCLDRVRGGLVLVEVKARIQPDHGQPISPTAAIHADKRRRLVSTANSLAALRRFRGRPVRIDVVTVEYTSTADRSPTVRHYPNAVTAEGRLR